MQESNKVKPDEFQSGITFGDSFQVGDEVKLEGWCEFLQVVEVDGSRVKLIEDDTTAWYDTEDSDFIKKGIEMKMNEFQSGNTKGDSFKVGDVVWCIARGKGVVEEIHPAEAYPVVVYFDSGNSDWYTKDGKLDEMSNRTLFFSEPKVEASVTRPFVPTLVGKTVIMEYFDGTRTDPAMVTAESKDEVFYGSGSNYKSDLTAIYEVSSENLLNP